MEHGPLALEVAILTVGSHICCPMAEPQVGMRRVNSLDFAHKKTNGANMVFEKVGDINSLYPYLCIYENDTKDNPFMEAGISQDKLLQYTIYANDADVKLSAADWMLIQTKAMDFLSKELANDAE